MRGSRTPRPLDWHDIREAERRIRERRADLYAALVAWTLMAISASIVIGLLLLAEHLFLRGL